MHLVSIHIQPLFYKDTVSLACSEHGLPEIILRGTQPHQMCLHRR